ncbi:putative RNA methyltransferase [Cytobacillus purgationiresistens]|uniref:23S rRNA (Guanine745-N1)-methyltransferase n=1 Tax=Cytobacillus purgationiresistens TaxID=863449 RepID=A0ABU0AK31_9BACI|nr:methyltransferase domain-containing protein [Cytobacillus purgationiresistens]MDQ0271621.1 23S rRNA (guanine745-N1)-methyltransferase [Cytobacillus purgationiresistens]
MSKKSNSAQRVQELAHAFKCPICGSSVKVDELTSLVCTNGHNFDFTKQGYLNLLTHAATSHYSKELFTARQKIIMEADLYASLHQEIVQEIDKRCGHSTLIADLGCGEGSHLQRILDLRESDSVTGVGLDIAKEGILMAAKNYENPIWLVGDLAKSPFGDQAVDVIVNILSPSNYEEFKRMLAPEGLVMKIVPRKDYLKELRTALFEKKEYSNEQIVSLFKKHFDLLDIKQITYTKTLEKKDLINLVKMTPLAWSGEEALIEQFLQRDSVEMTVDLDMLVGQKKK